MSIIELCATLTLFDADGPVYKVPVYAKIAAGTHVREIAFTPGLMFPTGLRRVLLTLKFSQDGRERIPDTEKGGGA